MSKQKTVFQWILVALFAIAATMFVFSSAFRIFVIGVILLLITLLIALQKGPMNENQRTVAMLFGILGTLLILMSAFGLVPNIVLDNTELFKQMNIPQQVFTFVR